MKRGHFIVFEGMDGSGKTTVAKRITKYLNSIGIICFYTREPGGEGLSEKIRELIFNNNMCNETEALLFTAARYEHNNFIEKALNDGVWIICDRYVLSTYAYQGINLDIEWLENLNNNIIIPDLTIYIDVDYDTAINRIESRNDNNRMDKIDAESYKKSESIFKKYLGNYINCIIDGCQDPDSVFNDVLKLFNFAWRNDYDFITKTKKED